VLRLLGWLFAGVLCLGGAAAMPAAAETALHDASVGAVHEVPAPPRLSSPAVAPVVMHRRRGLRRSLRHLRIRWFSHRPVALVARDHLPPPSWRGPPVVAA
jgi:hypothetical protein